MISWLIGFYIVEFEQNGQDRATYGDRLIRNLEQDFKAKRIGGMSYRSLELYKQFYLAYPQIWQSVTAKLKERKIFLPLEQELLSQLSIVQPLVSQL